ncbi:MAG: 4a-hydroxytetrahydrobiopterin dehydratase [Salibaculum sp.]|jgi:pterin-4a-carbinolamine dehydratase|uniref:4a-hydroxytetrahydrobiopterin dehydratase n=1 Tax=Salibaculum sp. TaxID=2855480 RepID=UPI00287057AF|nr:4a-hydroxytetrahydrobiopterin dehydratase [Salibaculum sp.]MDR9428239.1 4a-hydroxytetrahydrobiopterin dehydratase [Salibaculum sp.]
MTMMTNIQKSTVAHTTTPQNWTTVGKTGAITRRFEFPDYAATSAFLDALTALSEETGIFPDLGFAATYVNVTVPGDDGRDQLAGRIDHAFEGQQT